MEEYIIHNLHKWIDCDVATRLVYEVADRTIRLFGSLPRQLW